MSENSCKKEIKKTSIGGQALIEGVMMKAVSYTHLDDAALTQNYSLKYPKSGDHRSAFVFHDIDGDGEEEAIVFYEPSIDNTARIVLLDRQDGVWRSLCDLSLIHS